MAAPPRDEGGWVWESERLRGRRWRLADAEQAFAMYGDAEVTRFLGWPAEPDLTAMRARLGMIIARAATLPEGMGSTPAFLRGTERLVGSAICLPLPGADDLPTDDIQIGWHVLRSEWGRGYGTELGRAMVAYGFGSLGLERLHAVVEPPNLSSVAVARKLGMQHVGRTRAYYGGEELEHFVLDRVAVPEGPGPGPRGA